MNVNTPNIERIGTLAVVAAVVMAMVTMPVTAASSPLAEYNTQSDWESAEATGTINSDGTVTTSFNDGNVRINASLGTNTLGEVRLDLSNHTEDSSVSEVAKINVYNSTGDGVASRTINASDISSDGVVIVDFSGENISGDGYQIGTNYALDTTSMTIDDMTVWAASADATTYSPPADNSPPVADAGSNQTVTAGESLSLDASASSDPDGDTLTYSWDMDGDGTEDATGVSPTYTFSSAGTYTAEVTVTDSHGATATDTATITVEQATYGVTFNVTGSDGVSIDNGSVEVSNPGVTQTLTVSNGSASTTLADGDYNYTVSAEGFESSSGSFTVNGSSQTVDVSLTESTTTTTTTTTTSDSSHAVTFEFNLSDYDSNVTDLEVRQNGSVVASQGLPADASSVTENLSSGDYEVALVNDTGGDVVSENVSVSDSDLTVTVDGTEDADGPVVGIGSGAGGSTSVLIGGALLVLGLLGLVAAAAE